MSTRRTALVLAASILIAPVAARAQSAETAAEKVKVVATFSILADIARNVGGDRIAVTSLVGPNSDAHVYSPKPADAKALAAAKLIVTNGLGFEGWIERLIKAAGTKAKVVVASTGVTPRKKEEAHGNGHGHGHKGDIDPHAWQSVPNVKRYVANIRDVLVKVDPAGQAAYTANAAAYLAKLDALDAEIKAAVTRIPGDRRKIIVTHNAFGYFEDAYGVTFVPVHGVSTDAQPSARELARIIAQIKKERIRAVFLENVTDPRLIERIARETGAKVGGTLYSDALTDDKGPAPTYIDLMRHNAGQLAAALTG